jgi:hypothetical protein
MLVIFGSFYPLSVDELEPVTAHSRSAFDISSLRSSLRLCLLLWFSMDRSLSSLVSHLLHNTSNLQSTIFFSSKADHRYLMSRDCLSVFRESADDVPM